MGPAKLSRLRPSELALPSLAHEVLAEGMMGLLGGEAKSRRFVDAPRGDQDVVGPQAHALVARLLGEAQALLHQAPADPETARSGLDQQQTQLRHLVALAYHEHRAQDLALALGDPAALALRIEALQELGHDLGDQRLESLVPAIF